MYIRHVKGLELNGVEATYETEDARPPYVFVEVEDAELTNVKGRRAPTFCVNPRRVRITPLQPAR
jgi:hypothetical protein